MDQRMTVDIYDFCHISLTPRMLFRSFEIFDTLLRTVIIIVAQQDGWPIFLHFTLHAFIIYRSYIECCDLPFFLYYRVYMCTLGSLDIRDGV